MKNVLTLFEKFLKNYNLNLDQLDVNSASNIMVEFYKIQRIDNVDIKNDGDMLLFQWGTYDWGAGE